MAQFVRIYVGDDSSATLYYETQYRITGTTAWTQQIDNYPLPTYEADSPIFESAYIGIGPLADDTEYDYKTRRFNPSNQSSDWEEGTFTTGQ